MSTDCISNLTLFSLMSDCYCKLIIKRTMNHRLETRLADKNVITSAVFTKRWAEPRPKVRLLNPDGLLTLNCRHHLKLTSLTARRGGVLGRQRKAGAAGEAWKHRGKKNEKTKPKRAAATKRLQPSASETMELYLDLLSQPCRSVFMFAKAVGIPFEFKHIDLAAGNLHLCRQMQG